MKALSIHLQLADHLRIISNLTHLRNLLIGIRMNPLLDIFFCLFTSRVHFVNAFTVGLSPFQKQFLDHLRAHLVSDYTCNLFIMEECNFPVLMAKAFREVFEVGGLVPLDIVHRDKWTLMVRDFVHEDPFEDMVHCWIWTSYLSSTLHFSFEIDDVHEVNHQVFERQREKSVRSLVIFWGWGVGSGRLVNWLVRLVVGGVQLIKQERKPESYNIWKLLLHFIIDVVGFYLA